MPAAIICAAALLVNLNVLTAGFVWDDRGLIIGNPLIRSFRHLPVLFRQPFLGMYYRPVVMASFMADYALWGLRPWGYHLTNLLIHSASACLIFFLFYRLIKNTTIALVTALLFAIHPVHKGVVAIADRTGILSAFFFLLTLFLYILYRQNGNGRLRFVLYSGAFISCALAFFSKEETLALPLLILVLDWLMLNGKERFITWIATIVPFFILAGSYFLVRSLILHTSTGMISAFFIEPGRRLVTIPAVLLDYALLLIFPLRLDFEPRMPLGWIGEPRVLLAIFISLVCITFVVRASRKNPAAFGFLWYVIAFLPMSNIIPIYPEAARSHLFTPIHFLYLPSIGLFLCAAVGFEVLVRRLESRRARSLLKYAFIAAFCCLLLFFSLLSMRRNYIWNNEIRLYQYIVRMHPENPRMRWNLGTVYLEQGRVDEALDQLKQAVSLSPDIAMFRNTLALAYKEKGWFERATEELQQALRLDPDSAGAYANLVAVYRLQKQPEKAIDAGLRAVELAPVSPLVHVNLGLAYLDAHDLPEAEKHLVQAVDLDPDCVEGHIGLGVLFAKKRQYDLAREHWQRALELKPDATEARENLLLLEQKAW